jgi:hypothetical protein
MASRRLKPARYGGTPRQGYPRLPSETRGGDTVPQLNISDQDASILRELLNAKLVDMRRETPHTDSRSFRETLYEVEATLQRVLDQLPKDVTIGSEA